MNDLYTILGVDKDAEINEIKRAYRKAANKYHPDKDDSPEAHRKFREIQTAYEVLKDPTRRMEYDEFGTFDEKHIKPAGPEDEAAAMVARVLGDAMGAYQYTQVDYISFLRSTLMDKRNEANNRLESLRRDQGKAEAILAGFEGPDILMENLFLAMAPITAMIKQIDNQLKVIEHAIDLVRATAYNHYTDATEQRRWIR